MAGRVAMAPEEPSGSLERGRSIIGIGTEATRQAGSPLPLVIDLDADGLSPAFVPELVICALRQGPVAAFPVLVAAISSRGALDAAVAASAHLDPGAGLLAADVRAGAVEAHAEGREVVLLTSHHPALARRLCQTQAWADDVIVVPQESDLAELSRLAAVRLRCPAGFVTLPGTRGTALWSRSGLPYGPGSSKAVQPRGDWRSPGLWIRAARLHQWIKNVLLFLPLVLAGRALDPTAWVMAATGFLAFGLVASATYLLNDLHDLEHDRAHRSKRHRPLASGALPIPAAILGIGVGLGAGTMLAALGGGAALAVLALYLGVTLAYTFAIKRIAILDAVTLAGLFTLRLVAGVVFCGVAGSAWLFVLSMFLFTSLALAKRFVEIRQLAGGPHAAVPGRGYFGEDGPVVLAFGTATAAAAVLIVSLYIVEAAARQPFYATPDLLWFAPAAVFVWLGRVWILCGRGVLRDDPVEFAVKDKASIALGLAILASFCLACVRF